MKKQIISLVVLITLVSLVSAINIFSGESISFESEEFEYYEVVGNSSSVEGMNINWENGITTISFDKGFVSDSFTLLLFNPEKEIITEHHYSGGGGGGSTTKYVDRNITKYEFLERDYGENDEDNTQEKEVITEYKTKPLFKLIFGILLFCFIIILIAFIENKKTAK